MLQSVLENVGFNCRDEDNDEKLHTRAARKIIELYQDGLTDPVELTKEMRFLFGIQKHDRIKPWKPLPVMQSRASHCFTGIKETTDA